MTDSCMWAWALIIDTVDEGMIGDLECQTWESDNETDTGLGIENLPTNFLAQCIRSLVTEGEHGEAVMCDWEMVFFLSWVTSPYPYPFMVQYSLLAAAMVLTMWTRATRKHKMVTMVREISDGRKAFGCRQFFILIQNKLV